MAIFNRKQKHKDPQDEAEPTQKEKVKFSKRPASKSRRRHAHTSHVRKLTNIDTAFKQQRLKAWQPILTPKAVLPTLFIIGLIFAPIGALIVWGSGKVTTITLDYTQCDVDAPTGEAEPMPRGKYDCEPLARFSIGRILKRPRRPGYRRICVLILGECPYLVFQQ
jgi:hypothetical protein